MSRHKVIKQFMFEEANRDRLTFSDGDKIRLDPKLSQIQLKVQSYERHTGKPIYPTDTDLTVETWTTTPQAVRQWVGFCAVPRLGVQPDNTTIQFKLNDGTDDRYWDGGAWSVAGATDWNDEATIAANIGSFPVTQQLKVIVNLATTDEHETPTLTEIDLLMDCEIDFLDSIIHDAMVPRLKSEFRPVVRFGLLVDGGDKVSLLGVETPYNIVDVVRVYDQTNDPNHTTDILSSYSSSDKTITLTTSLERGTEIRFEYQIEPEVYVNWSSQDYTEVDKIPAVSIDRIQVNGKQIFGEAWVNDISQGQAVVQRFPFRLNLDLDIVLLAEKNRTLLKMWDRVLEFGANTLTLAWGALDEAIGLTLTQLHTFTPRPNLGDVHRSGFALKLTDIHLWLTPEETIPLVQTFNVSVSRNMANVISASQIRTERPTH